MSGRVLGLDGEKGAGTNMQRQPVQRDSPRVQGGKQLIGEMQARRRRGDRAFVVSKKRLVVGSVLLVIFASGSDVGRQRHVTERVDCLLEDRAVEIKAQQHFAAFAGLFDGGIESTEKADAAFMTKAEPVAGLEALRGFR